MVAYAPRQLPSYQLPSYGTHEYLFPAKPNVKYKGDFRKPHAWDLGKRFRRVCTSAGITDRRIHDLRHFATTMLFMQGIPDAIIRKMTGHRSEKLERYKHLSPGFREQSVERIAGELSCQLATKWATSAKNRKGRSKERPILPSFTGLNGGADGTRTRGLRRDSSVAEPSEQTQIIDEKDTWEIWAEQFDKVRA